MDFDSDGKNDIISGSYPGELYVFKGLGEGRFDTPEQIKQADGKPVKLGMAAVVFAHDWDADGDLDLLVGDIEGQVHLVPNGGSRGKSSYGPSSRVKAAGEPIRVANGDAGPSVADWDNDGTPDLLVGTGAGSVVWFRNTGTANAPQLAAAQTLVEAPQEGQPAADGPVHGTRAKVHATDWNQDGRLDLLVGDLSYHQPPKVVLTPEQEAAKKQKRDDWLKQFNALQQAPPNETAEARKTRVKKQAALVASYKETEAADAAAAPEPVTQFHGYVWLYLRQEGVAKAE